MGTFKGVQARNLAKNICVTDGNGNLIQIFYSTTGTKTLLGLEAPDGSQYAALTDGNGNSL